MPQSSLANRDAFLSMISHSEGTDRYGTERGYNVIVGGTLFHSYADHPRVTVQLNPSLKSTAAGRYQLLARYFDAYKSQLSLPDFSPASQDKIALQQIKERRALDDIDSGNIRTAIARCKNIWASFPGSGYGQHENAIDPLLAFYIKAGGRLA